MSKKVTVATVNAALKKAGYPERVYQAKDYVYFIEGDAHTWYTSIAGGVFRVTEVQDVNWWLKERDRLAADHR